MWANALSDRSTAIPFDVFLHHHEEYIPKFCAPWGIRFKGSASFLKFPSASAFTASCAKMKSHNAILLLSNLNTPGHMCTAQLQELTGVLAENVLKVQSEAWACQGGAPASHAGLVLLKQLLHNHSTGYIAHHKHRHKGTVLLEPIVAMQCCKILLLVSTPQIPVSLPCLS